MKTVDSQQTIVLMKTSWRRLLSLSSEDVFKTSSRRIYSPYSYVFRRRLYQDQYICLGHTSSRLLEDVFKMSSRHLEKTSCKNVFKTSSRRLQDVLPRRRQNFFKTSSRRLAKTSSRHFQDVFKTFSRRLQDFKTSSRRLRDVLKTSSRRLAKMPSKRFQDVPSSYTVLLNKFSICLQDVFTTFLRRSAKTVIYRRVCLGHTFEKFMVSVQNLQEWQQFIKF